MTSLLSEEKVTIALDAMGGDGAPDVILAGAERCAKKYPDVGFLIFGDENRLSPVLGKYSRLAEQGKITHTAEVISNDDKPSFAIRHRRNSSMALAISAVRKKEAVGVVSAGNTGALMAMSKIMLQTLPGIDRPAIGTVLPTRRNNCVMLDLGANVVCDENNLFEFAVMGDAFARTLFGLEAPAIGLLNIGTEEMKGNDVVKSAASLLRDSALDLNFYGHIEGDHIGEGIVDVIVTDGFSGNIALKTAEGTARMLAGYMKQIIKSSPLMMLSALFAWPIFHKVKHKFDPRVHNGAMLLGLNGIVIKSHGSADAIGFANAIEVAIRLARHDINKKIVDEMVQSGHIIVE